MQMEDFEKFVASQQEPVRDTDIRDEWLRELESLYRTIDSFLEKYIKSGAISRTFTGIELSEPGLGTYLANRMDIRIGRQHVSLVPIGTLLVNCKGRVDAEGSAGKAHILLVDTAAKSPADLAKMRFRVGDALPIATPQEPRAWAWKIRTSTPLPEFVDLDEGSFFDLLTEIANA